ncbi:MAG TPA: TlpA disulfide reductase family protein, partial [Chitinophagales bacterium]|nr:TlpA disulfide reductase family protein [Chitinophagales bacterium]
SCVIAKDQCDFNPGITEPAVAKLIYNNQSFNLFIEPGDEFQISIDGDSLLSTLSFNGKSAAQNQFLLSFYKTFSNDFDKEKINAAISSTAADAYEMNLFEQRKKQLAFYNAAAEKASFSEPFKKYVTNVIRYNYYARLLAYPIIQANQSPQTMVVKAFPAVMLEGVDGKLVNDEALNAEPYRDFLYYHTVYFASAANGFNKFKDLNISLENKVQTAMKNFSGMSLTWCIAYLFNTEVNRVSQYTAKHIYNVLNLQEENDTYTNLLKKKVDARLAAKDAVVVEATEPGSKSSAVNYPKLKDMDGNYFSIDDLKGKVVYVDFWASWCGPCMQQMPYSKKLHAMFDEKQLKQIVFLYISIDGSEAAWKSAATQLALQGKLGISPGNWQSPIAKFFGISSIPRYMLIDRKGEIVDLNAKRPSMGPEIYNDILKLLE